MVYFISGHRQITQEEFNQLYIPIIEKVLNGDPSCIFLVGDYYGADIMAQNYLVKRGFAQHTAVYHMLDAPRNLAEGITTLVGGFQTDEERDAAMTADSDFDIAFYNRIHSGTEQNILRRHYTKFKPEKID